MNATRRKTAPAPQAPKQPIPKMGQFCGEDFPPKKVKLSEELEQYDRHLRCITAGFTGPVPLIPNKNTTTETRGGVREDRRPD